MSGWVKRLGGWLGALVLVAQAAGCATCQQIFHNSDSPPVSKITATWQNQVYHTEDSVNDGQRLVGLVGRLYLFDKNVKEPLIGDGKVKVELFDEQVLGADGKPVKLEEWNIDKVTLRQLVARDPVGQAYTLFLPWSTCRPDRTKLKIKVKYEEEKRSPLYANDSITITQDNPTPVRPAAARQMQPWPTQKPATQGTPQAPATQQTIPFPPRVFPKQSEATPPTPVPQPYPPQLSFEGQPGTAASGGQLMVGQAPLVDQGAGAGNRAVTLSLDQDAAPVQGNAPVFREIYSSGPR